jgi:Holliday junction DNA helicase RuvB
VVLRFDFYDTPSLERIVRRACDLTQTPYEPDGVRVIASRARGTPRVALRLFRRVRDFAQVRAQGVITHEVAEAALRLLEIDSLGLDSLDRIVLEAIITKFGGGPVGLDTLAASVSEESDTIMDVVEPYLLQLGFLERTPRGRIATRRAYTHLGYPYIGPDIPNQASLFDS